MADQTRREFLKLGLAAAASAVTASAIEIPLFNNQNSSMQTKLNNANSQLNGANSQLSSANSQISNLKTRVDTVVGFISLSITEQSLLEKIVETIIPTDADPGAKEAGVIYFIDRQLAETTDRVPTCSWTVRSCHPAKLAQLQWEPRRTRQDLRSLGLAQAQTTNTP